MNSTQTVSFLTLTSSIKNIANVAQEINGAVREVISKQEVRLTERGIQSFKDRGGLFSAQNRHIVSPKSIEHAFTKNKKEYEATMKILNSAPSSGSYITAAGISSLKGAQSSGSLLDCPVC